MNIALVLSYMADRFGGPVAVAKGLGRAVAERGHNVSYWATADGDGDGESAGLRGVHLYPVDWPRVWFRSRGLVEGVLAEMSSFDVIDISEFWLHAIYAVSRLARARGVPYVLAPSGSLQPWALRTGLAKTLKKSLYLSLIGRSILEGAACIRAASSQEAENVRRLGYRGPVTVIPNGIHLEDFDVSDSPDAETLWPQLRDRPAVLFMSRISPEKGLDILISAWAELARSTRGRDAILVIAGPDYRGYRKRVEAMVDHYGLRRQVSMVGMVQGARKAALLRRADVFVLPSYSENFGIVVAEALACGTPVITTTATPWEQLQQIDVGRWIEPKTGELLLALRELLDMPAAQRAAMGHRGADLVRDSYTWDRIASKYLHVCQCIVEGKPIPFHPEPLTSTAEDVLSKRPAG